MRSSADIVRFWRPERCERNRRRLIAHENNPADWTFPFAADILRRYRHRRRNSRLMAYIALAEQLTDRYGLRTATPTDDPLAPSDSDPWVDDGD